MSVDETITINNSGIIVIHAYVLSDWGCQSMMIVLSESESDGATTDSLMRVIMSYLLVNCGLDHLTIVAKFLCFGGNGVATFEGHKNRVTKHIKDKFSSIASGQHYCAYELQLCAQVLSKTNLMSTTEDVLETSHTYIEHSSKRMTEFCTLVQLMETIGLKLLKNVKTHWISCYAPMQRLISKWKPVMAKIYEDGNQKKEGKKAQVSHLTSIFFLFLTY